MPHPYNPPRSLSLSFPFGRGRQLHELVRGARHCEAPAWLDHVRPGTPRVEPPPGTFHPSGPPPRPPPDAPRVLAPGGLLAARSPLWASAGCRRQEALCELVQAKAVHSHVLSVPVPSVAFGLPWAATRPRARATPYPPSALLFMAPGAPSRLQAARPWASREPGVPEGSPSRRPPRALSSRALRLPRPLPHARAPVGEGMKEGVMRERVMHAMAPRGQGWACDKPRLQVPGD